MADDEERAKAEKLAAAKKRVSLCYLHTRSPARRFIRLDNQIANQSFIDYTGSTTAKAEEEGE